MDDNRHACHDATNSMMAGVWLAGGGGVLSLPRLAIGGGDSAGMILAVAHWWYHGKLSSHCPLLALVVIQHWHGAGDYRTRHIWQDASNRPRLPSPAPKSNPSKPITSNRPAIKFSLCAWRVGT